MTDEQRKRKQAKDRRYLAGVKSDPEKAAKRAERLREWLRKHRAANRNRVNVDQSAFRYLRRTIRGRKYASRFWAAMFPFTVEEFRAHFERLFSGWMSWANYGEWEIHHVTPRKAFRYASKADPEFRQCWSLENLRPLPTRLNRRK